MSTEQPGHRAEPVSRTVKFAQFELDVRAGELRYNGEKIRLQEQPFRVLLMLLGRPGEVVLREEIRKKLWPNDTIVEFAPSINAAIQRLREALGDSAENPQYIETVARRGYRFIGELIPEGGPQKLQPSLDQSIADATNLTGRTIAHYRVYEKLGRGGMGEVYRARDTKLGRDVALKVLPNEFAEDADRMARFEREAQVLASLNHPNIAAIYGVEEASGIRALVMELVEGATLAERIARGAVPLQDALGIARQMADALEAAHEKGIVHRDLKPANVKVTPQGAVKVLDFGLATVMQSAAPVDDPLPHRAPAPAPYTRPCPGLRLPATFGVVLYEMLTGKRPFQGETTAEILSAVLTKEPEWQQVPFEVQRLLRQCFERDPKRRLRDIGDLDLLLEEAPGTTDHRKQRSLTLILVGALAMLVLASTILYFYFRESGEPPKVLRVSVPIPSEAVLNSSPAISPDGRRLAFSAKMEGKRELWVRDLDSANAHPLPGTEGALFPFWSPDARWLGFIAGGKLKKIAVSGGPAVSLADAVPVVGGSWSNTGAIIFSKSEPGPLFKVSAVGGNIAAVTTLDGSASELTHGFPSFLPDGHSFLYTAINLDRDKSTVYIGDIENPKVHRPVLKENSNAQYSPPGYLLFMRAGSLMAQTFDIRKRQTTGDPMLIAEHVDYNPYNNASPHAWFSVSQNGVLAYTEGAILKTQLSWFDRSGKVVGTIASPEFDNAPEVSPDGNFVAADPIDSRLGTSDIWVYSTKRNTASRFTFKTTDNFAPEWSPDSTRIAFTSRKNQVVYLKSLVGGEEEVLDDSKVPKAVLDWSRDGRYIIEQEVDGNGGSIRVLPMFGDQKPFVYQTKLGFPSAVAKLSPNGKWLAYTSDETRRLEIYVEAFPTHGSKQQISINGGNVPTWSSDGKELFFMSSDGQLMAVDVRTDTTFEAGTPRSLFKPHDGSDPWFSVSKSGLFLFPVPVKPSSNQTVNLIVNWTALKQN